MNDRGELSRADYSMVLRGDFASFARRCFCELYPRSAFAFNWHVEVIAAKLSAVRAGRIRRLIVISGNPLPLNP